MNPPEFSVAPPERARPLSVLLVEEHRPLANCLSRFLRMRGHRVIHVPDFAAAKEALADGDFDLLLTDVESADGGEMPFDGCPDLLPRFVLTMSTLDAPPERAGVPWRHHLAKPFAVEDLQVLLERIVEEAVQEQDRSRQRGTVPALVATILREASRRRDCGELSEADFERKLDRLTREELDIRGLELVIRPLSWGARYVIKQRRTGQVCDMIDWYTIVNGGVNGHLNG